jgi:hypothetical protein
VGGTGIEQIAREHPDKLIKHPIDIRPGFRDFEARNLVRSLGIHGNLQVNIADVLTKLYRVARTYEARSIEINPLIVQIKCPLVQPRVLKLLDVLKMKEKFQVSRVEIPYRDIGKADAFKIAREQIASLDVSMLDEGEPFESLFTGEAKITGNPILVDLHTDDKNIVIDVYMEDLKQSTGFIAYIKNLINMSLSYTMKISTSVEKVRAMIFNGFEFSTRLTELFDLCDRQESVDDLLLLLKELQIKAQSYFPDLKLTETLNEWFQQLEKYQEKEIYSRTYKNLQFDIQTWMESIIIFAETNAKIYYEAAIDETTRSEIARETARLKESLHQMASQYSKKILYTFMLIQDRKSVV